MVSEIAGIFFQSIILRSEITPLENFKEFFGLRLLINSLLDFNAIIVFLTARWRHIGKGRKIQTSKLLHNQYQRYVLKIEWIFFFASESQELLKMHGHIPRGVLWCSVEDSQQSAFRFSCTRTTHFGWHFSTQKHQRFQCQLLDKTILFRKTKQGVERRIVGNRVHWDPQEVIQLGIIVCTIGK